MTLRTGNKGDNRLIEHARLEEWEKGYREGWEEGYRQGREEGLAEFRRLLVHLVRHRFGEACGAELQPLLETVSDLGVFFGIGDALVDYDAAGAFLDAAITVIFCHHHQAASP